MKKAVETQTSGMNSEPVRQIRPSQVLIRRRDVEVKTALCRSAVYAKLNPDDEAYDGAFPVPVRIGPNSVRWIESEVDAYIATLPRIRTAPGGTK